MEQVFFAVFEFLDLHSDVHVESCTHLTFAELLKVFMFENMSIHVHVDVDVSVDAHVHVALRQRFFLVVVLVDVTDIRDVSRCVVTVSKAR